MEFNDIFEYLLIGNLISGKILYELKNTSDITIINDINQLFYNFSLQKKLISLKNNIDSYYISFAEEQLIMISKLKIAFSQEQNSELFETIRNRVPDLIESKYIIKHKYRKRNLYLKITNVIYDYFQYINVDKRIMSFSYLKNSLNAMKSNKILDNSKIDKRIRIKGNKINNLIIERSSNKNNKRSKIKIIKKSKINIHETHTTGGGSDNMDEFYINENNYDKSTEKQMKDNSLISDKSENIMNKNLQDSQIQKSKLGYYSTDITKDYGEIRKKLTNPKISLKYKIGLAIILLFIVLILVLLIPFIMMNSYSYR